VALSVQPTTTLSRLFQQQRVPFTLLGIGPMSRAIVEASIECAARERAPAVFIASRNQIDSERLGGGYVEGWTQSDLYYYVDKMTARMPGTWVLSRDHGGPWQRDDEYQARLNWDRALASAIASYGDDLDAGFTCLHIDTSRDPQFSGMVPLDLAVDRVVELVRHIETRRSASGVGPVDYEVSLETTSSATPPAADFDYFVGEMVRKLEQQRLPRPLFVVANTGTLTRMDRNVGRVDFTAVRQLRAITSKYGTVLKEHNADYLDLDALAQHPTAGIGMANVAPEFGKMETEALLELCAREEERLGADHPAASRLRPTLLRHVRRSQRWRKWTHDVHDPEVLFQDPTLTESIVKVCGHYFFRREDVRDARQRLYGNLRRLSLIDDPHEFIKAHLRDRLRGFFEAFNLCALTPEAPEVN
jgi:tagatose-1,6-bisphosphate aldolase non-catalytic subunit AgaZ/GatZ